MLALLLTSMLVLAAKIQPASADGVDWWPMFHHDLTHSGYSTSTGPAANHTMWSFRAADSVLSSPAVVDGRVYIGSNGVLGSPVRNFYCLDAVTGALNWSFAANGNVFSCPAVDNGRVYVGSDSGFFYCLDASFGYQLWISPAGPIAESSAAVVNGMVYIASLNYRVYCLNAVTGALVWNYTTGYYLDTSPVVDSGRVYLGSDDRNVYCLDALTGALVWKYTTGNRVWSSPTVVNGRVYVGSNDGNVYCLDASAGKLLWNYPTGGNVASSPAIVGGRVYVGSSDGKVYCLDASAGTFLWSFTTGGLVYSSPAVADGKVYVGSHDNNTYCLDAFSGTLVWSYTTGYWVDSSPAVVDGVVYIGSYDGKIYAFGSSSPQTSSTSIVCSPNPVSVGLPATCTATVLGSNPTGSVTWRTGSSTGSFSQSVCTLSSGSCSTTYTDRSPGIVTITASYSGDSNNAASSDITTLVVAYALKGSCSVVSLDFVQQKNKLADTWFSIQQNLEIPLKYDSSGRLVDYYWVQNVVYVYRPGAGSGNYYTTPKMGGGFQVWECQSTETGLESHLVDCSPGDKNSGVHPAWGEYDSTVKLVSEIEGNNLVMANNFYSHTFTLPNDQCLDLFIHADNYGGAGNPEIVIVGYGQYPGLPMNIDFDQGTKGSVDNSFLGAGSSSWVGAHNLAIPKKASCAETSTGLKWDASQSTFEYDDAYTDPNVAEQGFWVWPDFSTYHSAPSMVPSETSRAIVATIQCPAYLSLYDVHGGHAGFNATSGGIDSEIPGTIPMSNESITILNPNGLYNLTVVGTGDGAFTLQVFWQDTSGAILILQDFNGTITNNETQAYLVGADANVTPINILSSKTVAGQGFNLQVNTTVANLGGPNATFDIALYANDALIGTQSALNVTGWDSTTASFTWNTTGVAYGNYTLWANTTNNNCTGGVVTVTIPGDINGDFKVSLSDLSILAKAYGTTPASPKWNANADVNNDGKVSLSDLSLLAKHYGQHYP
jgi:outer membrane protein assembly factor BamB